MKGGEKAQQQAALRRFDAAPFEDREARLNKLRQTGALKAPRILTWSGGPPNATKVPSVPGSR
jgi:hypothetical protein